MTFTEAMDCRCMTCNRPASQHRLTKGGTLYCLILSATGNRFKTGLIKKGEHWPDGYEYRLPVRYLRRATFKEGVGDIIQRGLTTFA